jgi:hypothetical protein
MPSPGGDIAALKRFLREDPRLIHPNSTREHEATLLHYVSANGVEGYRQKTPTSIVRDHGVAVERRRRDRRNGKCVWRAMDGSGRGGHKRPSGAGWRANHSASDLS